jgi:hypothetical protein
MVSVSMLIAKQAVLVEKQCKTLLFVVHVIASISTGGNSVENAAILVKGNNS